MDNGGTVDPVLYFVLIIGITLLTYVFAIVFALLFEIPFYKLSNELLKSSPPVPKKTDWRIASRETRQQGDEARLQ